MADHAADQQTLFTDDFFYFFLRLRKSRIRQVVERVRRLYPNETPERQARRLVRSCSWNALAAGTVFHLPAMIPGFGPVYSGLGLVGGASALARMHLYLILEVAMLFGHDIDDPRRTPEMLAVVAGCSLGAAPPTLLDLMVPGPFAAMAGGLSATIVSQLIGESAIRFYKRSAAAAKSEDANAKHATKSEDANAKHATKSEDANAKRATKAHPLMVEVRESVHARAGGEDTAPPAARHDGRSTDPGRVVSIGTTTQS